MVMAPEPTSESSSSATDFGEKVSISQLILSRLDNIQHNQDVIRQDINGLRQEMSALRQEVKQDLANLRQEVKQDLASMRQEVSALRYWSWGSIVVVFAATVTIVSTVQP